MSDRVVFGVTERDLTNLTEEEFQRVWDALLLVGTARRRAENYIRDRATKLETITP